MGESGLREVPRKTIAQEQERPADLAGAWEKPGHRLARDRRGIGVH